MRNWVCTSSRRECLKTRAKCGAFPPWQQPLMTSILWQKWLSMPGEWYVIQASARFDATHAPPMQQPITVLYHSAYIRSGHSRNSFSIPKSWGFFVKLFSGFLSTKNSEPFWWFKLIGFWLFVEKISEIELVTRLVNSADLFLPGIHSQPRGELGRQLPSCSPGKHFEV